MEQGRPHRVRRGSGVRRSDAVRRRTRRSRACQHGSWLLARRYRRRRRSRSMRRSTGSGVGPGGHRARFSPQPPSTLNGSLGCGGIAAHARPVPATGCSTGTGTRPPSAWPRNSIRRAVQNFAVAGGAWTGIASVAHGERFLLGQWERGSRQLWRRSARSPLDSTNPYSPHR